MEVKTILSKIRQKEAQPSEYYFALEIGLEFIKSAIFAIVDNQVKVLSLGSVERWENEEELIEAVDASLSSTAEKLPIEGEVKEPDEVVFGLPFNWVEGEKIIDEKLKLLKKLSEKLDLKPAGFVVIDEAIVHHLKTTEGVPPTAILVHLGMEKINVALVRIGKILGPKLINKSDNLAGDLIEGLSRFESKEPLPARILLFNAQGGLSRHGAPLYNGEEKLEEAKQQLVGYPWLEKKKEAVEFLHLPRVEVLPLNFDIEAIALAGGKEVAKAAGLVLEEKPAKKEEERGEKKEEVAEKESEEKEEAEVEEPGFVPAGELGFVKGGDVAAEKLPPEPELPPESVELPITEEPKEPAIPEETKEPLVIKEPPIEEKPSVVSKTAFFAKMTSFRPRLSVLKKLNLAYFKELIPKSIKTSPVFILVGVLFLVLVSGAFAAYWYLPRAEVTLFLEPEILEKDFTVELDPTVGTPDKENFVLPAGLIGEEVEGTKSQTTTGAKDIGDPAKGEATIYNGTSNEKTFDSGTAITSTAGLEFTLDDDVTVASQSSAADPPGKVTVKVTAEEIGTEGNLAAGTEFAVANYAKSDYVAKNDSAFSGGISRQIQAVAEEDQEGLLADLKAALEDDARGKLLTQLSPEARLVEESISSKVVSSRYSHEVGEETDNLELTLKLHAKALVYTEKELQELVEDSVLESVPEDFEYLPEETEFSFDVGEVDEEGRATVKIHLKAKLIPQQDLDQIKKNLAGKYLAIGETYLGNLSRVTGFNAKLFPRLPGRLGTFPRRASRIDIKVEIQ